MSRIGSILICLALVIPFSALAETVRVGGYRFPPFVILEKGEHTGLTVDVIAALNEIQDQHEFKFFHTSSKRRYHDHDQGLYDVILFEDPRWEWADRPVSRTRVIARDEEVFVAHSERADGEAFFRNLEDRRLVGMLGYHYQFADYVADEGFLDTQFNILLSSSLERNLQLILLNRPSVAEVAIVPRSFLNLYFHRRPEARNLVKVSERVDQVYELRALVRKGSPISAEALDQLLGELEESGRLPELRSKYHLPPLEGARPES
ncbi:amino acid ABC transporter substrate-binding protein (PAAT family) [Halospina denitrificans]|uniref:Amino acid ABC transporter substrate-binding protein (PAAT family) n=1 Tax=Halospina denitrificans TaxID=332522 RepID=A0A4R7JUZ4_9GAMM|nr:transporter substrate-binding domain-containing protein [Halospina denitrificans]TDT41696.1 amino acid ABC transporter substrate-binding protein (PAAT family) [Halospina denitrificans]